MKPEKILIVDDEKRIVENISLCLQREGFQTIGVHDGKEALEQFIPGKFDLTLLDMSMPDMDGYEVMEHIFKIDKDAMIVMVTGNASVQAAVRALKIGAWDYLKKPFEYADLVKTVKNALSQQKIIADKKAMSARLDASEKQYGYIVNNSPDLIFTLDTKGCFTFVNYQFNKVLGLSEHDLLGRSFESIIHEKDLLKAKTLFQVEENSSSINNGRELQLRFQKPKVKVSKYDPDAAFAFMELKAAPINLPASDGRQEFKGVYAVARDVTQRINLEDQLRQAQKMEAIGTLAGGIAHDFNNILMGIQGYTSLVKLGFDHGSEEYRKLANIDEYVANGAEMAKQLLGFAQKTCHGANPVNLNFLLKMSAKMFGRAKKDVLIEQSLDKNLWGVVVDEGQIKQVLMNLFINAWQAMPNGGKIIMQSENIVSDGSDIHEQGLEKTSNYIKITVSDTGIGMDEDLVTRIFDPFFTTKERAQGTGLGLATAYGIIKSHKGILRVQSKPGKGSSFMIFLPAAPTRIKKTREFSQKKQKIYNGKGTILLVDDEKGVIEVCSEMLKNLGYRVKAVTDGRKAIDILKANDLKIDLVILDMVMPGINGQQTFEKIRTINPDLKVLVCSGYTKEDQIQKMIEIGCNGYILKPFDVAELSEKLNKVLKVSQKI
ncbi:MAG: response regulator [Desulfobacula sp.]|nr:response regulator [Desulfobacula sp.]